MMRKKTPISNRGTKTTHVIETLKRKYHVNKEHPNVSLVENKQFSSEPQKFQLLVKITETKIRCKLKHNVGKERVLNDKIDRFTANLPLVFNSLVFRLFDRPLIFPLCIC